MSVLDGILERKRDEVAARKREVSPARLAARADEGTAKPRGFQHALEAAPAPAVIAEIKHRSPSKGVIRADFDPVACARAYASGGAAALSVLTDEPGFGGRLEFLDAVRGVVSLPLLRKDFLIDPYQIDEARVHGADAVLLIVAALEPEPLVELHEVARSRGLDVLVEVHDEAELEVALAARATLIGVNNRDLRTFEVDLGVTERVAEALADRRDGVTLVGESGIHTARDIERLARAGARAFLVGESLMREADPGAALERLRRTN